MAHLKSLEWTKTEFGDTWYAKSILGTWSVWEVGNGYYRPPDGHGGIRVDGGIEAAKEAAFAEYERRLMGAFEPEA